MQVKAAGVNPVDTYTREGLRGGTPPFIPGKDGAGVIAALGDKVTRAKVRLAHTSPLYCRIMVLLRCNTSGAMKRYCY